MGMDDRELLPADVAEGMAHEMQIAMARARLEQAQVAQLMFVQYLRARYGAPEGSFVLQDWAVGFERVVTEEGNGND